LFLLRCCAALASPKAKLLLAFGVLLRSPSFCFIAGGDKTKQGGKTKQGRQLHALLRSKQRIASQGKQRRPGVARYKKPSFYRLRRDASVAKKSEAAFG
jgi:hypothetical protein